MLNLTIVITNKRLPQESTEQIYHRYIGLVIEINSFLYAIRKPQKTQLVYEWTMLVGLVESTNIRNWNRFVKLFDFGYLGMPSKHLSSRCLNGNPIHDNI